MVRSRRDDGASAVEFALVMVPLLTLFFGILQYGLYFWSMQGGADAARRAARTAAVGTTAGCTDFRRQVAGSLGAEIHGVDMARDLSTEVAGEVRQALLDHLVIFLREQDVTPPQQLAFARKFGEPIEYPQLKGLPD